MKIVIGAGIRAMVVSTRKADIAILKESLVKAGVKPEEIMEFLIKGSFQRRKA